MINSIQIAELEKEIKGCQRSELLDLIHDKILKWIHSLSSTESDIRFTPVSVLAKRLKIARQTAQKVYDRLESEKIIFHQPNERVWRLRRFKQNSLKCIALLLPMAFSEYYQLSVEYGQRHFNIYSGMTDRAMELGVVLTPISFLKIDSSPQEIDKWIDFLRSNFIGVIHLGNRLLYPDMPLRRLCETTDIPQISIDWEHDIPWGGTVSVNPEEIIRTVLAHLRENGHKDICLTSFSQAQVTEGFYTYSSQIFQEFISSEHDFFSISKINAGQREFGKEFEQELDRVLDKTNPPTAFWCIDDTTAMATIQALKTRGKRVPKDFSVIGFDNLLETQNFAPPITTLQMPRYEMGYIAISKLLECIENPLDPKLNITHVPCTLYARQSTAPNNNSINRRIMAFNALNSNKSL